MSQYDLFISYCRGDNENQHITELKEQIEADYLQFSGEELRCFFDLDDIRGMEDWRHRILGGLRESNVLLLILSPGYLASDYCEWEIVEYLKYEHSRPAAGEGIAPVYFVEVPGLESADFEKKAAAWVARVRRRHHFDLRPWYDEGAEALRREDVRTRMEALKQTLHARISKMRRITEAPGNLAGHNPYFVGRETEMLRVHEAAGLGRSGSLTVLQGVAGLGKTSLAIQYAYSYADFYPGGRWIVGCANKSSLAGALRGLDIELGIVLDDEEKRDDIRVARRVLAELERRANEGAAARAKEKNPPQPRALLLLDNVDDPDLLQPPQSNLITGKSWLHIVATTRLSDYDLGHAGTDRLVVLTVDKLPLEDSIRLIEYYQAGGRLPNEEERAAAHDLARLLDGFTLTVEVVAVHLGERRGQLTCAALRDRLQREGFAGLEQVAGETKSAVRHQEKLLEATLQSTLALLSYQERAVLKLAALLPADYITLPWLRQIVPVGVKELLFRLVRLFCGMLVLLFPFPWSIRQIEKIPWFVEDKGSGHADTWLDIVNHLISLRLIQVANIDPDTHAPLVVRMHRLLGELVWAKNSNWERQINTLAIFHVIDGRSNSLARTNLPKEWELDALVATIPTFLVGDRAPQYLPLERLAQSAIKISSRFSFHRGTAWAWQLLQPAHQVLLSRAHSKPNKRMLFQSLGEVLADSHEKIGDLLRVQGDLKGSLQAYRAALEIRNEADRGKGPFAKSWDLIAEIQQKQGNLAEALDCYRTALEIRERRAQKEPRWARLFDEDIANNHDHVGDVLQAQGDLAGALRCYQTALAIHERRVQREPGFRWSQRDLARSHDRVGGVLQAQGDLAGALPCYRTGLAIYGHLAQQHSDEPLWPFCIARSHCNIYGVLQDQGQLTEALRCYQKSLAIQECKAQQDPSNRDLQAGVAIIYCDIGDIRQKQGDLKGALDAFNASSKIRTDLANTDSQNTEWKQQLSVNHMRVGHVLRVQGDLSGGLRAYHASLDLREELSQLSPTNIQWQRDLCGCYAKLGEVTASLDITQSREWWGKCHQQLLSMREKGVLLPADEHLLETARRKAGL
jgi:tetratricopeptide (TPR) repeat protein